MFLNEINIWIDRLRKVDYPSQWRSASSDPLVWRQPEWDSILSLCLLFNWHISLLLPWDLDLAGNSHHQLSWLSGLWICTEIISLAFPGLPWWLSGKESACQMQEMQKTWDPSLGQEDSPGVGNDNHSSILAWKISWTEEPGGLQPMGSQRVRHNWLSTCIPLTLLFLQVANQRIWGFSASIIVWANLLQ